VGSGEQPCRVSGAPAKGGGVSLSEPLPAAVSGVLSLVSDGAPTRPAGEKRLPREFVVGYITEKVLRDSLTIGRQWAGGAYGRCDGRLSYLEEVGRWEELWLPRRCLSRVVRWSRW
jgi:hypothetical protein